MSNVKIWYVRESLVIAKSLKSINILWQILLGSLYIEIRYVACI